MYSTHNEGKSVVAEIYKYMTSLSKNGYNDKLDDIVKNIIRHTIAQLK